MNISFEKLCMAHEAQRFDIPHQYYTSLTDKERLYIKSSIAFAYEYYSKQYDSITEYTQQYTMCSLTVTKRPASFLLALVPGNISIPPLISLLIPAHILSIPIILNFTYEPSPYTLTAMELSGIEHIFIGAESSLSQMYAEEHHGAIITSDQYVLPNTLWHYLPPSLPHEAQHIPIIQWLYPDATYENTQKAHVSHITKESSVHLWVYPCISLDCYYSIDYTMR